MKAIKESAPHYVQKTVWRRRWLSRTWNPEDRRRCSHWLHLRRQLHGDTYGPHSHHHLFRSVFHCNPASTHIWNTRRSLLIACFNIHNNSTHRQPSTNLIWDGKVWAIILGNIKHNSCHQKRSRPSCLSAAEVLQSASIQAEQRDPILLLFLSQACGEGWLYSGLLLILKMTTSSLTLQTQRAMFCKGSCSDVSDYDFANVCTLPSVWGWPCAATQSTVRFHLPNGSNLQASHKTQQI